MDFNEGHAMVHVINHQLLTMETEVHPRPVIMGSVVEKQAMG